MLPATAKLFAMVRDLSARREVTEIPASRWLLQRHNLAALGAFAGVSQLRDDLAAATVRWIAISRELPLLTTRFREAGVGIAPIKGVAYAVGLYPVPAARPMTDVDLLVQPGREVPARDVLGNAGFRLVADVPLHHASTWERGSLTIDLHRGIVGFGRGRVALGDLWARTRPGWPDDARRLDPTDELVFHLIHMARNRLCGPLIQIVDAARLLEHATAEAALRRARDWQLGAAAGTALMYCRAVLEEGRLPRALPPDDDVLFARQPSVMHKVVFDVATAGSVHAVAARAIGTGFEWLARRSKDKVVR